MSEILERPTLVLNRYWQPVGVTPVARALVMLWNDVARVVEAERLHAPHLARLGEPTRRAGRPVRPGVAGSGSASPRSWR